MQLVLNLGPALMPDFMTGALFHAILAWPTISETQHFYRVSEELMADTLRATKQVNPNLVQSVIEQWPQYSWPSIEARSNKPKPALGYLDKRLKQRMAAARAGIGKMHEQIFNAPAKLPPGMTALSIDQLCALIKSDVVIDDSENIEKLVWRKSLPILHVAMATQLLLTKRFADRTMIRCDLQDIKFYREAVKVAQLLETIVNNHPDVAITADRMTLIRWFE